MAFNSAIVHGLPAATLAAHREASAMVLGVVLAIVSRTQKFGLHKGGVDAGGGRRTVAVHTAPSRLWSDGAGTLSLDLKEHVVGGHDAEVIKVLSDEVGVFTVELVRGGVVGVDVLGTHVPLSGGKHILVVDSADGGS